LAKKKGTLRIVQRFFFLGKKKVPKTPYFKGEKMNLKLPHLYIKFQQQAAKTLAGMLKLFKMSTLTCSQIWRSPLVDDCQSTYLTKLRKF
jgi:hypothetical protein